MDKWQDKFDILENLLRFGPPTKKLTLGNLSKIPWRGMVFLTSDLRICL
jgi:hypothetical protein